MSAIFLPPNLVNIGDRRVLIAVPQKMPHVFQPSGSKLYLTSAFRETSNDIITSGDITTVTVHQQYAKKYASDCSLLVSPAMGQTLMMSPWLVPPTPKFYTLADPVLVGNEWRATRLILLLHKVNTPSGDSKLVVFAPVEELPPQPVFATAEPVATKTVLVPSLGKRPVQARMVSLAEYDHAPTQASALRSVLTAALDNESTPLLAAITTEKQSDYCDAVPRPENPFATESLLSVFPSDHISSETREFLRNESAARSGSVSATTPAGGFLQALAGIAERRGLYGSGYKNPFDQQSQQAVSTNVLHQLLFDVLAHLAAMAARFGYKSVRIEWLLNDVPRFFEDVPFFRPAVPTVINQFYTTAVEPNTPTTVAPLDLAWVLGHILLHK